MESPLDFVILTADIDVPKFNVMMTLGYYVN